MAFAVPTRDPTPRRDDDRAPADVLESPTEEMAWWARRLERTVFPRGDADNAVARGLRTALVTPLAHVAGLSFDFQSYLFAVFHRTWPARIGHAVCMPAIVTAAIATAASLSPIAGSVAVAVLGGLWMLQARAARMPLLGIAMLALLIPIGALGIAWGYAVTAAWATPALWLVGLSVAQTLSHLAEPVPPRVSGGDDWVSVRAFFFGPPGARFGPVRVARRLGRAGAMVVAGTLHELVGSLRLLPVMVARALFTAGYQPEHRAHLDELIGASLHQDNPAVDFIGTGGARRHVLTVVDEMPR